MRNFIVKQNAFKVFLFMLSLLFSRVATAQFITYPVAAQPITRGLDSTSLTVEISFPACTGVTVRVNLGANNAPGLIEYIPGSVQKISGTGTITESNISNLTSPVFSVGNTTAGQTLRFSIKRRAFCGTALSSKDDVIVNGAGCSFSETDNNINNYSLLAAAFSITPPAPVTNAEVGGTYNRVITVINGGNGCTDSVGFWIKYPAGSMELNSVSFAGNPITPVYANADSAYFELTGAILGADNMLCNGESIALTENVRVLQCNTVTTYGAAETDYANAVCQSTTAVSGMSMSSALPSLGVTVGNSLLPACYVSGPRVLTYTIRNNGAGPATNIVINTGSQLSNAPRASTYGYIDTASLFITTPGAAASHPDPALYTGYTLTVSQPGDNNLSCNEGKIAHLQLTLPATVVLLPGDSIVLTYNVIYCPSTNSCDDIFTGYGIGTQVGYKNSCGTNSYTSGNYVGATSVPYNTPIITAFETPAQVRSGECYEVVLGTNTSPTNNVANRGYIEYELTMPPGATFSSATLLGFVSSPHAGYPRVSGNKVITRYNVNTGGNPIKFVFCSPTNLCTDYNLDAVITTSPDSTCVINDPAAINSVKRCATATISFVCSNACATGGIVPVYWHYSRKNFGAPDNNYNKLPDGSGVLDQAVILNDRYRPGDTLHSEYRSFVAVQTSPANITSWNHINSNWNFSDHIWVPAGNATVTIKRGVSVVVVPGVPITTTTYGKIFNADFSQGPVALTSLAPFQPNDSVIVEADFILRDSLLSTNASNQHMTAVDDGTRGKVFADVPDVILLKNSVHASTVANPTAANQATCLVPEYNINTLHLFHFSLLYGNTLTGCTAVKHEIRGFTRKLGGYTANYFPGEYRPEFIPDSLVLVFPKGMTVTPGSQSVSGLYINTPPTSSVVSAAAILPYVSISGSAATSTTVLFDVKTALANNPTWSIQSEGTTYIFGMDARGSCETPNTFTIGGLQSGHLYEWPSPAAQAVYNDLARTQVNSTYSNTNKPSVNISSPNATISAASDTACWSVLLQNTSGQAAPYNYLRLTNNVSFNNYTVKLGAVTITPNADGLYELGNIASAGSATLNICANTNSCVLDSFKVESGWSCAGYPTGADLAAYSCWKPLWLKANSLISQIQLSIDKQPSSSIDLCSQDTVIYKMNSAQANYADNPEFLVTLLPGMSIDKAEIEYPGGSGNWQTITPAVNGTILSYKVEDHTGVSVAGLPGTISNPGTANRAARIRIVFTTSCGFTNGSKISVQQRADRPCGDVISTSLGYNAIVRSSPVIINGAGVPGNISFNLSLSSTTLNCGSVSALSGNIIASGAPTSVGDTIIVTLPPGIEYAGNFASSGGLTVAAGYPAAGPGGTQLLRLKVPSGVSAGTALNYNFDVTVAAAQNGCGNFGILSEAERTTAPISCGGTLCTSATKSIIGSFENTLSVIKPDLSIVSLDYVSGDFSAGGNTTVSITVANTGTVNAAAAAYAVEFFCGNNSTPFATSVFPPAIPASGSASANLTVNVPASPVCNNGEIVTARIKPLTAANVQQCLCKEAARQVLRALPVIITDFNIRQENCKVTLSWRSVTEVNFKKFTIQYSTDGRAYQPVGEMNSKGNNAYYSFTHQPGQGRVFYRLLMTDKDGGSKYSSVVTVNAVCNGSNVAVYPNPVNSILHVNIAGYPAGTVSARLLNTTGQLVISKSLQAGANTINVNGLSKGAYALIIIGQKGVTQSFKIYIGQ